MSRTFFIASDNHGGGRVRSFWPAKALAERGYEAWGLMFFPEAEPGDLFIIHRPLAPDLLNKIQELKAKGCTVLIDEDDHLEAIIPNELWQYPDQAVLDRHIEAIKAADGLIVTTEALKAVYGPHAKRTWICPNYLPTWIKDCRTTKLAGETRIVWHGITMTHKHDLEWLAPFNIPDTTLVLIGDGPRAERLLGWEGPTEHHPFQDDPRILYRIISSCHLGIVPLADNPLNRSKSWLKALEYQTLGLPVVARNLPEQRKLLNRTGTLVDTLDGFIAAVRQSRELRLLGELDYRAATENAQLFTLENNLECWENILNEHLPQTINTQRHSNNSNNQRTRTTPR